MFNTKLVVILLLLGVLVQNNLKAQLVLNEVSQGTATKEYAEFVVIGQFNCNPNLNCLDLRGWYLDDNNGVHAVGTGTGIAAGTFILTQNQLWSCIPFGTLILIYNAADPPANLPATIDTTMADGNCRLIFPVNLGGGGTNDICNFILNHTSFPTSVNNASAYPSSGFNSCPVNPDWSNVAMANSGDSFHTVDPLGNVVHAVSWGNNTLNTNIYFSGSATGLVFNMENSVDNNPYNQSNWASNLIAGKETPGAPNNAANAAWLSYLSNSCTNRLAFNANVSSAAPSCGLCNGTLTINAINGFQPYAITVNGINQSTLNLASLCSGNYSIRITDSIGCTIDTSIVFSPEGSITINASITDSVLCSGDTSLITLSGATNYTWNPLVGINLINDSVFQVTPSSNVIYTFIAGTAQCGDTVNVNISVNELPPVDAGSPLNICSGQLGNFNASGANSYSWIPTVGLSSSTIPNPQVNITVNTIYTVIGEVNGCVNSDTVGAYITSTPVLLTSNDTAICENTNLNLSVSGAESYSWLPVGNFVGSTSSQISLSPLQSQFYTVIGFNDFCKDTSFVSVAINQNPIASISAPAVCSGDSSVFLSTSIGSGLSFIWSLNNTILSNSSQVSSFASTCGLFPLKLNITDVNGCKDSSVIDYKINCLPVANFSSSDTVSCSNKTIEFINMSTYSPGDTLIYNWDFGNSISSNLLNPVTSYNSSGNYSVSLTAQTQFGCIDTIVKNIKINAAPLISILGDTVCKGDFNTIQVNAANHNLNSIWTWNLGNGTILNDTAQITYTYLTAQDYIVSLIVANPGGCSDTAITYTSVVELPKLDFIVSDICLGQINNFSINNPSLSNQYAWDLNNDGVFEALGSQVTTQFTDTGLAVVALSGINAFGCSDTLVRSFMINPLPTPVIIPGLTEVCFPQCITLQGDPSLLNLWYVDNLVKSGDQTSWCLAEGTHDVNLIVENNLGCKDSVFLQNFLVVNPKPDATYFADPAELELLNANPFFNLLNPQPGNYFFSFGDSTFLSSTNLYSVSHQYQDTGTYNTSLIVLSDKGCSDTAELQIRVKPDFVIYIPNAFTPNNDKFNDEFKVIANGIISEGFVFRVFDRWGYLMFETTDITKGWDGKYQNEECPIDHYAYTVTILDYRKRTHDYTGTFTLVR
jgi:gliding motility-associated-like protein